MSAATTRQSANISPLVWYQRGRSDGASFALPHASRDRKAPRVGLEATTLRLTGRAGGIGPVLLSTIWVLAVCLLAAVPIGLGAALFLVETVEEKSHLGRSLQLALDVLSGVPSIVFGLFGNRFFQALIFLLQCLVLFEKLLQFR